MELEPPSHSITKALTKGGEERKLSEEERKLIVAKSDKRYGKLLRWIAEGKLPESRRRSSNQEDAVQEALRALDKTLKKKNHRFRTGSNVRNWLCKVVERKAIDVFHDNQKLEGASRCAGVTKDDSSLERQDPAVALDERAGLGRLELLPEELADMNELQEQINGLSKLTEDQLQTLPDEEKRIVECWLAWGTFRAIAAECEVTVRDVRNTTYDFKSIPKLQDEAIKIRKPLLEAITSSIDESPELRGDCLDNTRRLLEQFLRFYFVGRGLRLLVDLREEP